jgi:hypothetical protein
MHGLENLDDFIFETGTKLPSIAFYNGSSFPVIEIPSSMFLFLLALSF